MLAKRIIPCLDVDNGQVVKGVQFVDIKNDGVLQGGADAVLAVSTFHFDEYTFSEAKQYMAAQGIETRL